MKALSIASLTVALAMMAVGRTAVPAGVVAAPGSFATTWATPVSVVVRAEPAFVVNHDIALHALEALSTGDPTRPWCVWYPNQPCPLFWAAPVAGSQQSEILGLDALEAGKTYAFRCSLFPNMRGLLLVRSESV